MSRATKERLERDAVRFGLATPSQQKKLKRAINASLCEVCGICIAGHSDAQVFACAKRQKGITP